MAAPGAPQPTGTAIVDYLNAGGRGGESSGQSVRNFLSTLAAGSAIFGLGILAFLIVKHKLFRIYRPRTYLVPEKERTKPPPDGLWQWLIPVFKTSNSDFISKCGLDAYFFLRYLRLLLKIFVPLAFLILPILIPVNSVHGRGPHFAVGKYAHNDTIYNNVTGLDLLAWGNVRPDKNNRYWVHLVLALVVIVYTCFVFFDELRGYIRLRQSYLTSPQHRLRASATTVLVTAIPRKWCTFEALDGLYDVFPGGIRNIWVNRNFDELNEKVKLRNKLARSLESAQTDLIRNAKKAQLAQLKKAAKNAPKQVAKEKVADQTKAADESGKKLAMGGGISSGDPHQVHHTLDEALDESSSSGSRETSRERRNNRLVPIPVIGQGVEAVGHGIENLGKTMFRGLKQMEKDVDGRLTTQGGYVPGVDEQGTRRDQSIDSDAALVSSNVRKGDATEASTNAAEVGHHARNNTPGEHQTHVEAPQSFEITPETAFSSQSPYKTSFDSRVDGAMEKSPQSENSKSHNLKPNLLFWKQSRTVPFGIPSPTPHGYQEDEFPLSNRDPTTAGESASASRDGRDDSQAKKSGLTSWIPFLGSSSAIQSVSTSSQYPEAYNKEYDPENDEPIWKKYLTEKDRDTMRLPIFGWQWMPALPFLGQKVDTIDYCRKEVARLNVEIEQDQKEPEKFPLMNSAFIQFNHQVAAHMACQSVSHHTPQQMTPRIVEISPDDIIWDNMSIKWWENYARTGGVVLLITALILGWAVPVGFTGVLGNLSSISRIRWLSWINNLPKTVLGLIGGVLTPALLSGLMALLPVTLRFLANVQGNHTGMAVELSVQNYYFTFLFVQVFLVVSISTGFTVTITQLSENPTNVPGILASNLPRSTNYFFSYMLLQALSVSAGALVQLAGLFKWFFLAPIMDTTGRQKWKRQTDLTEIHWGSFFPVYTNLAAIGLIYSVISPLIMVFNIVTFSLFWLVYRYNTLYVTKFRFDTGGLLFPKAINQLFTGLYVMELCLIGLFFLVRDADEKGNSVGTPCKGQAIIMIIVLILTVLYQLLLNNAFGPLFRYLPITLEDEAVLRDEEFARAQEKRWRLADGEREGDNINDVLEERERRSLEESRKAEELELKEIDTRRKRSTLDPKNLDGLIPDVVTKMLPLPKKGAWADRSRQRAHTNTNNLLSPEDAHAGHRHHDRHQSRNPTDIEAQKSGTKIGDALFSGLNDEIEDLTPEERDKLVQRAFQHSALRARRPVIWVPRDDLGVSDNEIRRTQKLSEHIWISNEFIGLDGKCRVIYRKSPPDFSEVDLIEL
ncbi:MAG: hypothetical protein Q9166_006134 [cf. Caloplaca sp. 2 TL-2023]